MGNYRSDPGRAAAFHVEGFMNTREAAAYLHFSEKTIRIMAAEGVLRHERVGRNGRWLRFRREWLDQAAAAWREK